MVGGGHHAPGRRGHAGDPRGLPGPARRALPHRRAQVVASQPDKERPILEDLRSKLAASDSAAVTSVTLGVSPASGLNREAYFGGWRVVEQMRRDGLSLADIARIPEAEMPRPGGQGRRRAAGRPALSRAYTSTSASRAFSWMNSRRGSTRSPIRRANMSPASSAWFTLTCSRVRASASRVVSQSWSAFISPSPL